MLRKDMMKVVEDIIVEGSEDDQQQHRQEAQVVIVIVEGKDTLQVPLKSCAMEVGWNHTTAAIKMPS